MKCETMFVACGCHYSEIGEFEEYMIQTSRGVNITHIFRYQKRPYVTVHVFYYDEELNYHHREKRVPYKNCRDEMKVFYNECVNNG